MSALTRFLPRERRTLVADALLFAAAFGGAGLALLTLLDELVGDSGWYEPASIALMAATVLLCPMAAWRLHGHAGAGSPLWAQPWGWLRAPWSSWRSLRSWAAWPSA